MSDIPGRFPYRRRAPRRAGPSIRDDCGNVRMGSTGAARYKNRPGHSTVDVRPNHPLVADRLLPPGKPKGEWPQPTFRGYAATLYFS